MRVAAPAPRAAMGSGVCGGAYPPFDPLQWQHMHCRIDLGVQTKGVGKVSFSSFSISYLLAIYREGIS